MVRVGVAIGEGPSSRVDAHVCRAVINKSKPFSDGKRKRNTRRAGVSGGEDAHFGVIFIVVVFFFLYRRPSAQEHRMAFFKSIWKNSSKHKSEYDGELSASGYGQRGKK